MDSDVSLQLTRFSKCLVTMWTLMRCWLAALLRCVIWIMGQLVFLKMGGTLESLAAGHAQVGADILVSFALMMTQLCHLREHLVMERIHSRRG